MMPELVLCCHNSSPVLALNARKVRSLVPPTKTRSPAVESTAYFVVSESLTNAVKHSGADSAEVRARVEGGALWVEVRDNGVGGARLDGGSGLLGLHDRLDALNGQLRVESPPGGGTLIGAVLPLPS